MKQTANLISNENQGLTNSFSHLISLMTNLISTNTPKHQYQLEVRDREVCIDLPTIDSTINDKVQPSELKHWITDVVKTTISSAFNSFSKNQMSYEQAKIYCSENIFKNIVRLRKKYCLSDLELKLIDDHIKDGVLKYLAAKYPQTDSTLANKKLQARVRQIDNIEALDNNYFTKSEIVFEFRSSGNYNDLIMKMLNDLMSMPDAKPKEKTTNYQDFQKKMSELFQKVEGEEWTNKLPGRSQVNKEKQEEIKLRDNEEKEKYRAKVKEYTHYLIGRKVSENSSLFTQAEIENGNIQIKNPQILRILTKWCEELYDKYSNSYFSSRSQSVKLQRDQKINILLPWMRGRLDQILGFEKKIINTTMSDLLKNNYEMQASVLQNELDRHGDEYIDEIQKISGKFSHKIVKNLHSNIIIYLNKLIHGLLKAARELFDINYKMSALNWLSPPNLLSFKIGDMMRCKCSSKEKEILRIYQDITRISRDHPQQLKIVRIKNRLRSGTNDILMNVRFNDSILCQIQLAINTTTSEFIKCSNKFNHYLYELQRSIFGPLTQLGSIWNSLDKRADIYEKLVEQQQKQQNKPTILQNPACLKQYKKCDLKPYDKSFVCNSCKISYFHNRFIMSHVQCSTCSYILCAKCRIKDKAKKNLKELLGNQERFIDGQMVPRGSDLPKFGLCVSIESNQAKVQPFTRITYQDIDYLLSEKESGINSISRIRSEKEKAKFRNNFLVFEIKNINLYKPIQPKQAINKYILPLIMKQNYKKQKETISLMGMSLNNDECSQILSVGSHSPKQCVKNIFLTANSLKKLPFDPKQFPNVQWITLNYNQMKALSGIEVFECKKLKHLDLSRNEICQIDDRIKNLTNLEVLNLQGNQITTIPQSIGNLTKLKEINFALNKNLAILPSRFAQLNNLQLIDIVQTSISKIPCTSGGFAQLKILRIYKTKITQFPQCFKKFKKIQEASFSNLPGLLLNNLSYQSSKQLAIRNCGFSEMPSTISNMKNLRTLDLRKNKLEDCKYSFSQLRQLQSLNLYECNLIKFPNLSNCFKLKNLNISHNALTLIPADNIKGLDNLQYFNCFDNKLTVLPTILTNLKQLRELNVCNNQLITLFGSRLQQSFDGTSCWPKLNIVVLNNNYLSTISLSLCYCPKLEYLNMANNKIELIPPEIKHSFNIKTFVLFSNSISQIPDELSALTQLSYLDLNANKIVRIPLFVQNFTKLNKFHCNNETIQTIQCLDWMLNNRTIDFGDLKGDLKGIAKNMKQKQFGAKKMKSLDHHP